jgi:membrane-bound lytic murein transglycosylase D
MRMRPRRHCFTRIGRSNAAATYDRPSGHRLALALLLTCLTVVAAARVARADDEVFPRPRVLDPAIAFWRDIFATYSEHQVVVHDDWYLGKVYEVLDFRSWVSDGEPLTSSQVNEKRREIDEATQRVRGILLRLDANGDSADGLGPEEHKVYAMFADVHQPNKFREAADRIRTQAGLRERFALGIARQRGYLERMQRIFRQDGLPPQLARLPLIESCFDVNAYSKVGAAGVWQFMPATGRQYMQVSGGIDERRDPLRATRAAARHLSEDYEALGSWPLAITAYNHGRGGLWHGAGEVGSLDIGDIVMRYHGKAFGFASRNFYAEFLAALDVSERADELFGDLPHIPAVQGDEIEVPHAMGIQYAARLAGVSTEDLIVANPAFLSNVADGRAPIPRGYQLRVPPGGDCVQVAHAEAPPRPERTQVATRSSKRPVQVATAKGSHGARSVKATTVSAKSGGKKPVVVHRVRPGQTLGTIARQYGTTVEAIRGLNNCGRQVQAGQRLRIPT